MAPSPAALIADAPAAPAPIEPAAARTLILESPVGPLRLRSDGAALIELSFWRDGPASANSGPDAILRQAADELDAYFRRKLTSFTTPLAFPRGSDFRRRVWDALLRIPYGFTRSYADIAREIGQPTAMRAVGAANGANPIAIMAPCHRVIGAKGALVGFGGGLDSKRKLLELEGVFLPLS